MTQKFLDAQKSTYTTALAELKQGHKQTHWMWFIFPQIDGLGHSPMAKHYAIKNQDEAQQYLDHPILGPRLIECTEALLKIKSRTARQILGDPDDLKLRSSMTLFATISPPDSIFHQLLDQYYQGQLDLKTIELIPRH